MVNFQDLGLETTFNGYFKEHSLRTPTDVQEKVIPKILKNESMVVLSQTGSGKTLSYALPLSKKLKMLEADLQLYDKGSPRVLVIAPTRELAAQVFEVFKGISHHLKFRVRLLTGGDSFAKTKSLSQSVFDVLIATPSRAVSALKNNELSMQELRYLVLDEADQLMDMGFNKDMTYLLSKIKTDNVKISMFTATLAPSVELLMNEVFDGKEFAKISMSGSHRVQEAVETFNISVDPDKKLEMARMFIDKTAVGRGMIFCNQKNLAANLFNYLKAKKPTLKCKLLHGDLTKEERLDAIESFKNSKIQFLVCSDVAARGIDATDMNWVLNYDLPKNPTYYLHRCGRTGRMGAKGVVYNFVTQYDYKFILTINEAIKKHRDVKLEMIQTPKLIKSTKSATPKEKVLPKKKNLK